MSPSTHDAAFLVPRRTIRIVVAVVLGTNGAAGVLVVLAHQRTLPEDVLLLEIAAGLLLITLFSVFLVPFRLRRLHRRLQHTLQQLESGTVSAAENPLGSLGAAFQEHYRHLWRSNILHRGALEVHRSLVQNLVSLLDAGCIVLDGKGTVHYRSEAAAALGGGGDTFDMSITPPISELISLLAAGDSIENVTVAGVAYYCYPVFGPVLLQRSTDGGPLLQPREGLAFVLLTDRPLKNVVSHSRNQMNLPVPQTRGVIGTLERFFSRRDPRQ